MCGWVCVWVCAVPNTNPEKNMVTQCDACEQSKQVDFIQLALTRAYTHAQTHTYTCTHTHTHTHAQTHTCTHTYLLASRELPQAHTRVGPTGQNVLSVLCQSDRVRAVLVRGDGANAVVADSVPHLHGAVIT